MNPVPSLLGGRTQDLASLLAVDLEILEHGMTLLARAVPLGFGLVVDLIGQDRDGRPALVLVEDGVADSLFLRAARAVAEFARQAELVQRLYPEAATDPSAAPGLILAARRFPDRILPMLALIDVPWIHCLECTVVDGPAGPRVVVTARGEPRTERPSVRRLEAPRVTPVPTRNGCDPQPGPRRDGAPPVPDRVCDPGASGPESPVAEVRRPDGSTAPVEIEEVLQQVESAIDRARDSEPVDRAVEPGTALSPGAVGRGSGSLLDAVKRQILRMSPDVYEEGDGRVVLFHVGHHRLARVEHRDGGVLVAPGDARDGVLVLDGDTLEVAVEAVFERFFGLVARRRAGDPRESRSADPVTRNGRASRGRGASADVPRDAS